MSTLTETPRDARQAFVIKGAANDALVAPATAISIAVDTAYVVGQAGGQITTGIYMFDNMKSIGSTGEGTLELSTVCSVGDHIGFLVEPIDVRTTDTVAITGFTVSSGNVFGGPGYPVQVTPSYWVGKAVNAGGPMTYQIQVLVMSDGVPYYVNWDPFISAT
jgi:hypothetical protein